MSEPPRRIGADRWQLAESHAATFKMKYIRHKKLGFILFEGSVQHAELARSLGATEDVLSAGFVFAPNVSLKCLGHSSTLNLSASPADETDLRTRMAGF